MSDSLQVGWVILACLVGANLPFVNERFMLMGPRLVRKHLGWRLLELLMWAGLCLGLGFGLEARMGQIHPQGWEFYAAFACLFLTLAFPGFVWRYLRRGRHAQGQ